MQKRDNPYTLTASTSASPISHGAFFGPRLQMATDTEQRYLAAMAASGSAPYRSADVAQRFGVKDQRGASVHREALIHKGLIWSPVAASSTSPYPCSPSTSPRIIRSTPSKTAPDGHRAPPLSIADRFGHLCRVPPPGME